MHTRVHLKKICVNKTAESKSGCFSENVIFCQFLSEVARIAKNETNLFVINHILKLKAFALLMSFLECFFYDKIINPMK